MNQGVYDMLRVHVEEAERKHPVFCGLRAVYSEFADLEVAVRGGERQDVRKECMHLAVVALRMYENGGQWWK